MGFAEQLKKARLARGLTQQQVAEALGVTNSTYCGYETGKRQPDVMKIKRLADILHTSGDVLLETGLGDDSGNSDSAAIEEANVILNALKPDQLSCALEQLRSLYELQNRLSERKERE